MQGDVVTMSNLFVFRHAGMLDGRVAEQLVPTGVRPTFLGQLA